MDRLRISCPHCNQIMEVRKTDAEKRLRCARCKETFRNKPAISQMTIHYAKGQEVIRVNCRECDEQFGVRPAMSGKTIACPKCKSRQSFMLLQQVAESEPSVPTDATKKSPASKKSAPGDEAAKGSKTAPSRVPDTTSELKVAARTEPRHPETTAEPKANAKLPAKTEANWESQPEPKRELPRAVVKKEAGTGNRATVVHSTEEKVDSAAVLSERAKQLLPPRYTVAEDVEREAASEIAEEPDPAPAFALDIDTDLTRIHRGGEAVQVQSLSINEKRRRKSLRVAIVYVVSVLILLALFVWLVQSAGSGD